MFLVLVQRNNCLQLLQVVSFTKYFTKIHIVEEKNMLIFSLMKCNRTGNEKLVEFYLKRRASVNAIDSGNRTALHWSAQNGRLLEIAFI